MALNVAVENVFKCFRGTEVLRGLSLEVKAGELFCLLGPSGCGKTTLLRIISGLLSADRGQVRIGGQVATDLPPQRRPTAMVFQNFALWPHMSAFDNVAFGLKVRRVPRAERASRVRAALDIVRLGNLGHRRPAQLSGGQQQRVALARALVVKPDVLLMDEPLSSLDAKMREEMRVEIRRICKEAGLTLIYVTHDQKEAMTLADRIAILDAGLLAQVGAPSDLYRHPRDAKIASFLGEANLLSGRVEGCVDGVANLATPIGSLRAICPSCAPSGNCTVMFRPESVEILPGDGNGTLRAQVVDRVFLGDVSHLSLSVGDARIRAVVVNRNGSDCAVNNVCFVRIDPSDVSLLPVEQNGRVG